MPAPPVYEGSPASALPPGLALAGYGARVLGAVVDLVVRLAIVAVLGAVGAGIDYAAGGDGELGTGIGALVGGAIAYLAYAPYLMATRNGQTWGHQVARVRVVKQDGRPIGGGGAFVREVLVKAVLFEAVGTFMLVVPAILNYLWPLWGSRNEALHDKLCGTLVVQA